MDLFHSGHDGDVEQRARVHIAYPASRPRPLAISPWLAMALLQKSIRRADPLNALSAASTLLDLAPERLWRRIVAIGYEDIGHADLDTIAEIARCMGTRERWRSFGDDWTAAAAFVIALCSSPKDRSSDDLLIATSYHPALDAVRSQIRAEPVERLLDRLASPDAILGKAIAATRLAGSTRWPGERELNRPPQQAIWDALRRSGCDPQTLDTCAAGYRKTREVLPVLVAVLGSCAHLCGHQVYAGADVSDDDDVDRGERQSGIPLYALDMFSREGKLALSAFLRSRCETTRWLYDQVSPARRTSVLGGLLFRVESGLVRRRKGTMIGEKLRHLADTGFHGLHLDDPQMPLRLLRRDLPALDDIRRRTVTVVPRERG